MKMLDIIYVAGSTVIVLTAVAGAFVGNFRCVAIGVLFLLYCQNLYYWSQHGG